MSTDYTSPAAAVPTDRRDSGRPEPRRVRSPETKAATKTTELIAYVAAVVGVLLASAVVGNDDNDFFRADRAWFYVVLLTMGYMVSRGLAKSGSHEHHDA